MVVDVMLISAQHMGDNDWDVESFHYNKLQFYWQCLWGERVFTSATNVREEKRLMDSEVRMQI